MRSSLTEAMARRAAHERAGPREGRAFTTEFTFKLRWKERLQALTGGPITVTSRVVTIDGEQGQHTEGQKVCRWVWE